MSTLAASTSSASESVLSPPSSRTEPPRLPPELIAQVLSTGAETWPFSSMNDSVRFHRRNYLCKSSRVCKEWTEIAQGLLWEKMWVASLLDAGEIMRSQVYGKFRTRIIGIFGGGQVDPETAIRLLSGLKGVQDLLLIGFKNVMHEAVPDLPSLQGVSNLVIQAYKAQELHFDPTRRISFPLKRLNLRLPFEVNLPFYPFFTSSTITQLTVSQNSLNHYQQPSARHVQDFTNLFSSIAPQLVKVHFRNLEYLPLAPVFKTCTKLKDLTITVDESGLGAHILRSVVSPLNYLKILAIKCYDQQLMDMLLAVREGLESEMLKGLRILVMEAAHMSDGIWIGGTTEWRETRDLAEEKGCEIEFVEGE